MFKKKTSQERPGLITAIDETLAQLNNHESDSEEFKELLTQLERLYKLQTPKTSAAPLSADTIVSASANLAGILMIISYEHVHAIGSKAVSFVRKT